MTHLRSYRFVAAVTFNRLSGKSKIVSFNILHLEMMSTFNILHLEIMSRCCYFIVCRVCITPIFKSTFYFCHNLPFLNMKKTPLSSLLIMLKKSSPTFLELFFQFFRSSLVGRGCLPCHFKF